MGWMQSNFKRLSQQDPFDLESGFYAFFIFFFIVLGLGSLLSLFLVQQWKKYHPQNISLQETLQAYLRGFATSSMGRRNQADHRRDVNMYQEIQSQLQQEYNNKNDS